MIEVMDVQITASIIGGLISGLFTFLGVFLTIEYQRKKDKAEEKKEKERLAREEFANRPRLEIIDYTGETLYEEENGVDLGVLVCCIRDFCNEGRAKFYYDKEIKEPEKWVFVEYVLKNTGNTEINRVYFSTNLKKNTAIFNTSINENVSCYDNNFLTQTIKFDKYIKHGESFKLRIYFVSNKIVYSNMGNPILSLWIYDEFGKFWIQSLDAPNNKISDSKLKTMKEYYEYTDERTVIECFLNPYKW